MGIPIITKDKSRFRVKFNKAVYNVSLFEELLEKDSSFAKRHKSDNNYIYVTLRTPNIKKVLEWVNYVFYYNKTKG